MKVDKGPEFPKATIGFHQAVCYGFVDIGTHSGTYKGEETRAHQCVLLFEYAKLKLDDGRPMVQSAYCTMSLGDQSKLYKWIKSWFGKSMSKAEKDAFDSSNLIGKNCVLQIAMNQNDRPKVENILPLMEGMEPYASENETIEYEFQAGYIPEGMYPYLVKKIKEAEEWNTLLESKRAVPEEVSDTEPF